MASYSPVNGKTVYQGKEEWRLFPENSTGGGNTENIGKSTSAFIKKRKWPMPLFVIFNHGPLTMLGNGQVVAAE